MNTSIPITHFQLVDNFKLSNIQDKGQFKKSKGYHLTFTFMC